jgi:hypothetical protein
VYRNKKFSYCFLCGVWLAEPSRLYSLANSEICGRSYSTAFCTYDPFEVFRWGNSYQSRKEPIPTLAVRMPMNGPCNLKFMVLAGHEVRRPRTDPCYIERSHILCKFIPSIFEYLLAFNLSILPLCGSSTLKSALDFVEAVQFCFWVVQPISLRYSS